MKYSFILLLLLLTSCSPKDFNYTILKDKLHKEKRDNVILFSDYAEVMKRNRVLSEKYNKLLNQNKNLILLNRDLRDAIDYLQDPWKVVDVLKTTP